MRVFSRQANPTLARSSHATNRTFPLLAEIVRRGFDRTVVDMKTARREAAAAKLAELQKRLENLKQVRRELLSERPTAASSPEVLESALGSNERTASMVVRAIEQIRAVDGNLRTDLAATEGPPLARV